MQFSEAVVRGAFRRPDGTQELELDAVSRGQLRLVECAGGQGPGGRSAGRPACGALCRVTVTVRAEESFNQGDRLAVEFFYPGEQAGLRLGV